MTKSRSKNYLKIEITGYTIYGGYAGGLRLLWEAVFFKLGKKTIREDKRGNRYVMINGGRYYFRKGHSVYDYDLYSVFRTVNRHTNHPNSQSKH